MMYRSPTETGFTRRIQLLSIRYIAGMVVLSVLIIAAWLTHVIVCLKAGLWGFLIAGAIVVPIAVIHGIGIWFGLW